MNGEHSLINRFFREIRRTVLAGVFILIPVVLSVVILWRLFEWADKALPGTLGLRWPPFAGLFVSLFIVYIVGLAAKNWLGRKVIATGNAVIVSIPILNKLYLIIKQIVDTVTLDKKKLFERVVLLKYPHDNCFVIGFVTSEDNQQFSAKVGKNLVAVFVPNAPNPTTGFLFYVPEEELVTMDIPVEYAFKLVLSAGVLGVRESGGGEEPVRLTRSRNWLQIFRSRRVGGNKADGS
jgi:uncharacterized membrane protein